MTAIGVIVALIVAVVGVAAGYFIGYNNRKKTAEAQIGSAEAEATRLVNEAIKTADQKRKEAVLEAKDEAFRLKAEVDAQKAEADKEIKQRRAEISRQENRIDQKETALDRKTEALEKKEEELKKRAAEAEERLAEIDALRAKEMERLETLAGLSQEDAREVLLHKVDEELTHEKAVRIAAYETDLKENCDNIARNLIGQAVSRCAGWAASAAARSRSAAVTACWRRAAMWRSASRKSSSLVRMAYPSVSSSKTSFQLVWNKSVLGAAGFAPVVRMLLPASWP